jgi:hypothetical protein
MSRHTGHFFRIWLGTWSDADQAHCIDAFNEIRQSGDLITCSYFEAQYALLQWVSSEYREADRILSHSVSSGSEPFPEEVKHWKDLTQKET